MKGTKLTWVLRLYPRAWRDRYEAEFLAVLEQYPATAMTFLDLLLGALDAHLYPQVAAGRMLTMAARLRTAVITVLWAWVGFVIVGMAFQKLSEDPPYQALAQAHTSVGLPFNLIVAGAVVTMLATAVGGLPIAYTALRSALAERRSGILALFALPVLVIGVAYGGTMLLVQGAAPASTGLLFAAFVILWVGAAAASTAAGAVVVVRSAISERLFNLALRCAIAVTLAMALVTVSTAFWGFELRQYAPALYFGHDGILSTGTAASWLQVVALMAVFTALAAGAVIRGVRSDAGLSRPVR